MMIAAKPIIVRVLVSFGVGQFLNPTKDIKEIAIQTGIIAGSQYVLPQIAKMGWKELGKVSYRGVTAQMGVAATGSATGTAIVTGLIAEGLSKADYITPEQARHYQDAMFGVLELVDKLSVDSLDLGQPLPQSGWDNVKAFPENFWNEYIDDTGWLQFHLGGQPIGTGGYVP